MTYLSLNRRWRPRAFDEVTRQEHVTQTLRNAVTQGRIAQAYLFGGRRGTGKTTMARLLAMCLNCRKDKDQGPTAQPCGQCESCEAITAGSSPDVIELDAASNRGIDEIRALQENVRLSPMSGRYKIYIIDEAHQMTKDAYNAFLKTLEEPPPHVVFVLATTEPEKILPTVRSRCQRFDFRPVPETDIARRLQVVAEAEKIEAQPELFQLISRKADGSLRDALGLLEQCVAFAGERPSVADFLAVTGGVERDSLERLSALVREGEAAEAIAFVDELIRSGRDPGAICSGLIGYLREVFLVVLRRSEGGARGAQPRPGETEPEAELVRAAEKWTPDRLVGFMDVLARAEADMRYSPQPRLVLEMALLGLGLRRTETGTVGQPAPSEVPPSQAGHTLNRTTGAPAAAPPQSTGGASPPAPSTAGLVPPAPSAAQQAPPATAAGSQAPPASPAGAQAPPASPADPAAGAPGVSLEWLRDNWAPLLDRVRKKSVFTRAFLLKARPTGLTGEVLTLGFEVQFHKEHMEEEKNRRVFEDAIMEATRARLRVKCALLPAELTAKGGSPGPAPSRTEAPDPTPAPEAPLPDEPPPGAEPGPEPRLQGASSVKGPGNRSQAAVSETMRSALSVFGGRILDDGEPEGRS